MSYAFEVRQDLSLTATKSLDYDYLTGLYNRSYLMKMFASLSPFELPLSIIVADANGFKQINDMFGYTIADKLLQISAEIFNSLARSDDLLFRIGGDEFAIILPRTDFFQANQRVENLENLFWGVEHKTAGISYCFGIASTSSSSLPLCELFRQAENNMYKNKIYESTGLRGRKVSTIVQTLNETHPREELHSRRVGYFCEKLAKASGLKETEVREVRVAGMLHDTGKIAIGKNILEKCGPLTELEFKRIQKHPEIGYRIMSTVYGAKELAENILCHHERWDGRGYPQGLKGNQIPLCARIIAIADTYDAITSDRPYREAVKPVYARNEILKNAGTQFDPNLAKIFAKESASWH